MDKAQLAIFDSADVAAGLDYPGCIAAVREAMAHDHYGAELGL